MREINGVGMDSQPLDGILGLFKAQIAASIIALIVVLGVAHTRALSFLLGEGVMLVANAYLCWRVLRQRSTMQAMGLVLSFFGGELGKYVMIAIGTFLCARFMHLNWLFYVIGLGVPQLGGVIIYGIKKS